MSRTVALFVIIFFLSPADTLNAKEPSAIAVSLVKLLVDPHLYDGANVEVMGYATIGLNFYLTEDHANIADFSSSIRISDTDEGNISFSGCLPGYISIRGKFAKTKDNNYSIRDVTSAYKPGFGHCWVKADDK